MPDKSFDLGDYVQVKDRIAALFELFGQARIETAYELTTEPDDRPKVICRAMVYRTPEDLHPSTGTSWMYLPGTTSFTKSSEIENAETSAIGRAIGFMGILIDKSIASANEIAGKAVEPSERNPRVGAADYQAPASREDGLIGVVEKGKARTTDYSLRLDPDGNGHLGFRLLGGGRAAGIIVEVHDDLAKVLASLEDEVVGQRVQAWGHFVNHPLAKGGSYDALYLERIATPDFTLPAQLAGDTAPASAVEPEPSSPSGSAEAVAPGEAASAQNLAAVPERPTAA